MLNHRQFCLLAKLSHTTDPTLSPQKEEVKEEAGTVWPWGESEGGSAVCHTKLTQKGWGMLNKRRWSLRQAGGERRKAWNRRGRSNLFSANETGAFGLQAFSKGVRREGRRSPEHAGGLLVWLSVLIRRPGRVIRPPRALGPACPVAHVPTCPGWWKQSHKAVPMKAVFEFLEISKNVSLPGAPHPQEHKLWKWQLFHYFPTKIQKQNQ